MINMAYDKEKIAELEKDPYGDRDTPKYPYGLSLYLNDDVLAKLGNPNIPVGSTVQLNAIAKVTGTSQREEADGDVCQTLDIQITDMEILPAKNKVPTEKVLWEGDES